MSKPTIPSDINDALALYFDNQASPEICKQINDWVAQDPANARLFAEFGYIERMIYSAQKKEDASAIFAMLAEMEDAAEADTVTLLGELPQKHMDPVRISGHDLVAVIGHVLRQTLTSRPAIITGLTTAAAAILVLTLILINPFASNTPAPQQTADNTLEPNKPAESAQPTRPDQTTTTPVATLTNTHNATWGWPASADPEHPLTTGSKLHPGTRLTLTAGFAEITTARGAIAILEAPATIELIDSPNALHLHAGKLVGICETDASKGFLVRTTHMNITDLGTRFGVSSGEQASNVRVIEGEVEVAPALADANATATPVVAGQAVMVDVNAGHVQLIEDDDTRFVHHWQALANAPDLTGPIRYEPSIPSDLRVGASKDKDVRLFHERSGVVLDRGVQVNVLEPGRYIGDDLFKRTTLSNVTADSYLVHFDSDSPADEAVNRTVTIRFDRPIVGVITASAQLVSSHNELGLPGVRYGNQSDWAAVDTFTNRDGSGLDVSKTQASIGQDDAIQLSDDRQTLTLDLFTVAAIDQVRVLVQSKIQDQ